MKSNRINSNKVFKSPLFRILSIIALFFSFLFVGAISSQDTAKAAIDYCKNTSGGYAYFYINDNGECENSQWNSQKFTVYNPVGDISITSTTIGEMDSEFVSALSSAGWTSSSQKVFAVGVSEVYGTPTTSYSETDHCTGSKYYNTSQTGSIYVVTFYSVSTCNIFKDSGATKNTDFVLVIYIESTLPSVAVAYGASMGTYISGSTLYYSTKINSSPYVTFAIASQAPFAGYILYDGSSTLLELVALTAPYSQVGGTYYMNVPVYTGYSTNKMCMVNVAQVMVCLTYTVKKDHTSPTVSSFSVKGSSGTTYDGKGYANSSSIRFTASISDNSGGCGYNSVGLADSSGTFYTSASSSFSNTSATMNVSAAGTYTITLTAYDNLANTTTKTYTIIIDKSSPVIDSSSYISSGTIGDNGGRYVSTNTLYVYPRYSDNYGIYTLSVYDSYTGNSCTTTSSSVTGMSTSRFSPSYKCDITNIPVNFTTIRYVYVYIYDYAGNYSYAVYSFYRIDNSRVLTLSSFSIQANGAFLHNYIGAQYTTSGGFAPVYSITANSSYLSTAAGTYFYIEAYDYDYYYYASLYHPFTSGYIGSGSYYWFSYSEYSSFYSALSDLTDMYGSPPETYATVGLKNIYGQASYQYLYDLTFDLYDPYIDYFEIYDEDGSAQYGYTNQTDVYVYESSYDDDTGVAFYEIYSDEGGCIYSDDYYIPYEIDLNSTYNGYHYIEYYVYDYAGNYAYYYFEIIYDDINPTISSFSAADNDTSNNDITPAAGYTNSQAIKHSLSASDSNIYSFKILDGSTTIYSVTTSNPNGVADTLANTTAGTHTLTVYVTDRAGNSSNKAYNIVYDATDPTISSYSATDNDSSNNGITPAAGYTNSQAIKHTLSASDTNIWKYKILDGSNTIYGLTTTSPNGVGDSLINTTEGTHTLKVYVYDKAGNGVYKSYNIIYDATNPIISSYSAVDNDSSNDVSTPLSGYTNSQNIKHSLSASDTNIWKYKILDGSNTIYSLTTASPNGVSDLLYDKTNGNHVLNAYVYDKAGNTAYKGYTIVYDDINPSFNSTFKVIGNSCALSGYTNQTYVTYSGASAIDANPYLYRVTDNGTTINAWNSTAPTSGTLANTTNGNHLVVVNMIDKAGNSGSATFGIVLDTVKPTFTDFDIIGTTGYADSLTPYAGYTGSRSVTFNTSGIGDATSGVYWYQVSDGGTTINAKGTSKASSGTLATNTNGAHTLTYTIWDRACNSVQKTDKIILDNVRPVINVQTDQEKKTTIVNFTDTYLSTPSKLGTCYSYYMSTSNAVMFNSVTPIDAKGSNSSCSSGDDVPMYISGQSYYLYVLTDFVTRDNAGNVLSLPSGIDFYNSGNSPRGGSTYRIAMNVNVGDYGNSSVPIDPDKLVSDSASKADIYNVEIVLKERTLMVTIQRENFSGAISLTLEQLNNILGAAGYKILGIGNSKNCVFTKSYIYHDVLISKNDHTQNEIIDLILVIDAIPNNS